MLCFDGTLLGDYLDGTDDARRFLQRHESEPWAVSSIVLYEALMGVAHGYVDGDVATVEQAVTASMDVLDVTARTAVEAAELQEALLARGRLVDYRSALVAASAREHGATFATAEAQFRTDDVRAVLDVAIYDPR